MRQHQLIVEAFYRLNKGYKNQLKHKLLSVFALLPIMVFNLSSVQAQTGQPELSIDIDYDVYEQTTTGAPGKAAFAIRLSEPSASIVIVNFETVSGTAVANDDYIPRSGKIFFQPGDVFKTRTITMNVDTLAESTETFSMRLSNPVNATISVDETSVNVLDGGAGNTPEVSISGASVSEAKNRVSFQISLSEPNISSRVIVDYQTLAGTALADVDYISRTGRIIFQPGQTVKYRSVSIVQDADFEADETFMMQLSNPMESIIATGTATAIIINDDLEGGNPEVTITGGTVSESDNRFAFRITLSKPYTATSMVDFETFNGTATDGLDFVGRAGNIVFQPGQTEKTRTVTINEDTVPEINETFGMRVTDRATNTTQTAFVTINDNDLAGNPIAEVSTGEAHSCALYTSGNIKCWGSNYLKQLGNTDNSEVYSTTPIDVQDITNAISIGSGDSHSCALMDNGEILCWGDNRFDQLGNTTVDRQTAVPVKVTGINQAISISINGRQNCALLQNNSVSCWGNSWSATPVHNVKTNAVSISIGAEYGCALLTDGDLVCWSDNEPHIDIDIENVVSIDAASYGACAVIQSGGVKCWGSNDLGQLGNGTTIQSKTPVDVIGITNAIAVGAGGLHACALLEDESLSCWGGNFWGLLGNGYNITERISTTPVKVKDLSSVESISIGGEHSCAITGSGVSCWGYNGNGQLGNGLDGVQSFTPVLVSGIFDAINADMGDRHGCTVLASGGVKCRGENRNGTMGNQTRIIHNAIPGSVFNIDNAVDVSSGYSTSCLVDNSGTVKCWGENPYDMLGTDSINHTTVPIVIADINNAVSVSTSRSHICTLLETGKIKCQGLNNYGQLGNGMTTNSTTPVDVILNGNVVSITTAGTHNQGSTCALLDNGQMVCWGNNDYGLLGDGTGTDSTTPVYVSGVNNAVAISMGVDHACAVLSTGKINCWGYNGNGRLGLGHDSSISTPTEVVGIDNAISVSAGTRHTCAVLATGTAKCWGYNRSGALGNGNTIDSFIPVDVAGIDNIASIHTGHSFSCAILNGGTMKCWGSNRYGQLGNGGAWSRVPTNVIGLF